MADKVENSNDHSYSANSDDDSYNEKEEIDRDEVKEMRKLSSKDTTRIRLWRFVVTLVLLLTACAVTFTTYSLLQQQEHQNFVTAVCYVICFNLIIATSSNCLVSHCLCFKRTFGFRYESVCTILPNCW
jgi:hypothetical protein